MASAVEKETATALEASIYKSLVMGPPSKTYESSVKSKKSVSAWSLASKLAGSHSSLTGKQKKSSDEKEPSSQQSFQKTKERRSLRGRVAALVRQRMGALASNNTDTTPQQGPKTFGIPLEKCYMSPNYEGVPLLVEVCISIIEERGLDCQGIYRIPGNAGVVHELEEQLDKSPQMNGDGELWREVNVVGSLLKLFFRKLPESLLPPELYDRLMEASRLENYESRMLRLKELLDELPDCNYMTLRFLMEHLNNVASQHEVNKMDAYNLSIMFGPALVRPKDDTVGNMLKDMADQGQIIENLIKYSAWFFDQSHQELSVPANNKVSESTSPHLLPNTENLVELQVARETQARELVASFEQFTAANFATSGSKTRTKTRKRSKSLKDSDDPGVHHDLHPDDHAKGPSLPNTKQKLKETKSSSNLENFELGQTWKSANFLKRKISDRSLNPADIQVVSSSTSLSGFGQIGPESHRQSYIDDGDDGAADVEIMRYPARRFDTNTFYIGSDAGQLSTLEKYSTKSASAECLDKTCTSSEICQEPVYHAATMQVKPRAKPPVPPKPKTIAMSAEPGKGSENDVKLSISDADSTDAQHSERSGCMNAKFKEQLDSALRQRYDRGK